MSPSLQRIHLSLPLLCPQSLPLHLILLPLKARPIPSVHCKKKVVALDISTTFFEPLCIFTSIENLDMVALLELYDINKVYNVAYICIQDFIAKFRSIFLLIACIHSSSHDFYCLSCSTSFWLYRLVLALPELAMPKQNHTKALICF